MGVLMGSADRAGPFELTAYVIDLMVQRADATRDQHDRYARIGIDDEDAGRRLHSQDVARADAVGKMVRRHAMSQEH